MRLSSALVERTLSQIQAQAIPDNHPVVAQLSELFGDHTFFLDENGLNIVEPSETPRSGMHTGQIVNLASWKDEAHTSLTPHEPEPTDVVIVLESEH